MFALDLLSFDDLCHVYEYLPLLDLLSASRLGNVHNEVAHSVARRRHHSFSLILSEHAIDHNRLLLLCQFLAKCVRSLIIEFDEHMNAQINDILVELVTGAEHLTELTLFNPMSDFNPGPSFLSRVQRLEMYNVSNDDDFVGGLLSTAQPNRLDELIMEDMRLSGRFLLALPGQLRSLHLRDLHQFNAHNMQIYAERYPHMQLLEIQDSIGGTFVDLPPLVAHLQHVQELRLYTNGLELDCLHRLSGLRILHITIERNMTKLLAFLRAVPTGYPLHQLCLEATNIEFCEQAGQALHRLQQLDTLELNVQNSTCGVDALLRGCIGHPALRELRLTGLPAALTPRVAYHCLQGIRSLHLRVMLSNEMELLAQLKCMRTLKVRLLLPLLMCRPHQQNCANRFVRALATQNQLNVLHLQICILDRRSLVLEPLTIAALNGFTSLRELKLVGRVSMESLRLLLCAMVHLDSFENEACSTEVAKNVEELQRLRPSIRRLRVSRYPEEL